MKNHIWLLAIIAVCHALPAQQLGINLSAALRKSFHLTEKSRLDLRQQMQLNPEIEKYNNQFGDFFNEDGFWRIPDEYEEEDDNSEEEEDDDEQPGSGKVKPVNNGTLNDVPHKITFNWRSNTSFQYNYSFKPWLRGNTAYALLFDGRTFRHTFRAELDYRPLRHDKRKKKVDLAARVMYQYVGQAENRQYEWDKMLIPRFDFDWTFKKNHIFFISNSINTPFSAKGIAFDRYRIQTYVG
jgi:hypothetical protein